MEVAVGWQGNKAEFPHDQGKVRFCLGSLSRLPESSPFESWGLQWGLGV